jgi:hypothetical protein
VLIVDDMFAAEVKRAIRDLSSVAKIHHNDLQLGPSGSRNAAAQASGEWAAFLTTTTLPATSAREATRVPPPEPGLRLLGWCGWGITSQGTKEYWG